MAVKARAPFQPAPTATPIAAISSLGLTMGVILSLSPDRRDSARNCSNASASEVEGVIDTRRRLRPRHRPRLNSREIALDRMWSPAASLRRTRTPSGY